MTQQEIEKELVGQTITNIYRTPAIMADNGWIGPASYFEIVLEIESEKKYRLGLHDLEPWNSVDPLFVLTYDFHGHPAVLKYINEKIIKVLTLDPNKFVDGSLSILLENDVFIAHEGANGDQLFIGDFKLDYYDELDE